MIKLFPIIPPQENIDLASRLLMYARRKKRKASKSTKKRKIVFLKYRYSDDERGMTKGTPPSKKYDYKNVRNRTGSAGWLYEKQMREEEQNEPEEAEYVYPEEEAGYRRKKRKKKKKSKIKW